MADIRIKDITTTASSTANGDFFVIDGTTGTRKVNAFNASFGGDVSVTGTLSSDNNFYCYQSGYFEGNCQIQANLSAVGDVNAEGVVKTDNSYKLGTYPVVPSTDAAYASIYIDPADGDLKVKFANGVVKTIATN
jgi:hypothetical protein